MFVVVLVLVLILSNRPKKKKKQKASTYIVLETGKFHLAVIASLASVRAEIAAVVVVGQSRDLLAALHSARDRVQRA